jgi:hypothetical protein
MRVSLSKAVMRFLYLFKALKRFYILPVLTVLAANLAPPSLCSTPTPDPCDQEDTGN